MVAFLFNIVLVKETFTHISNIDRVSFRGDTIALDSLVQFSFDKTVSWMGDDLPSENVSLYWRL